MSAKGKRKAPTKTCHLIQRSAFLILVALALFLARRPAASEAMPSKAEASSKDEQTNWKKKRSQNQTKLIYLIRHGQSQGQTAKKNGLNRKRDPSLVDCGLSDEGIQQAMNIPSHTPTKDVELVVSSPLTRALQTAVLGFPQHPILVHYGLREIGSSLPENLPRGDIDQVVKYIQQKHRLTPTVDGNSLKPAHWPDQEQVSTYNRTARIQEIFQWIARERTEQTIAVVCHYGVISAALAGFEARPRNAVPIPCHLHPDGRLVPIS